MHTASDSETILWGSSHVYETPKIPALSSPVPQDTKSFADFYSTHLSPLVASAGVKLWSSAQPRNKNNDPGER